MYSVMSTGPDIGYIMQFLSQANKSLTQQDWSTVKRVLWYLKGTRDIGITFQWDLNTVHAKHEPAGTAHAKHNPAGTAHTKHDPLTPWGFWNANYTEDSWDQKSKSGYVFMLTGGPILWKSKKKQASVGLSTMEAEYYALLNYFLSSQFSQG